MKIRFALCILLSLTACDFLKENFPSGKATASAPYESSIKKINPDFYEMTLTGNRGVTAETLKKHFKEKGSKLCKDKVYLLRGMREETTSDDRIVLKGSIDCVEEDYFKDK